VLLEHDVCQCAGERLAPAAGAAAPRLTRLVKNAGCASKIPPAELARVLSQLPTVSDPRLLVGPATADDAGVFQVSDDLCLVQTVDVFTPSVDDPHTFGRIAAANSLSDVYAMGGRPLTALSIIGYPIGSLDERWMREILRGGLDALAEAGVVLVGGHSIADEEIKFGFAVTGLVHPQGVITNAGAQPGDALILTKPLGTGVIAFAAQMDLASPAAQAEAAASMAALNRAACEVMVQAGAHACTDVTGFGLLGHLYQVVRESGVTAEVWWEPAPLLAEVRQLASRGAVPGAAERNREFASPAVTVAGEVAEHELDVLYSPETSGGLLFAVPAEAAEQAVGKLRGAGCAQAAVIGRVVARSEGRIVVRKQSSLAGETCCPAETAAGQPACCQTQDAAMASAEPCCEAVAVPGGGAAAQRAFQQFMAAAFAPGALDALQKELMTIALSVAVQCAPCLRTHLDKAVSMGITREEIQEAAWMGVVFGGCKAMMFWHEQSRSLGTKLSPGGSKLA
jgi:selenide,water dikinase